MYFENLVVSNLNVLLHIIRHVLPCFKVKYNNTNVEAIILNKNKNARCEVPRQFRNAQKAYFSKMLCRNLFASLLVSISPLPK
jgi:hypothetical protein